MAKTKKVVFNPYSAALTAGAIPNEGNGGINWSYVVFPTQRQMDVFIAECDKHGYRTRNNHKTQDGKYSVQYHHYED